MKGISPQSNFWLWLKKFETPLAFKKKVSTFALADKYGYSLYKTILAGLKNPMHYGKA